jgi:glutathione S-transferase
MKLYGSAGSCSLSPHIVLREAGIPFDYESVALNTKKTREGLDFNAINPKGYVPVLALDNGSILTEGVAIVQYLADLKPESKLAPPAGTLERYRLVEWLNFVSTEIHKGFSPLFGAKTPEEFKVIARERLAQRLAFVDKELEGKSYLLGGTFTVADAYLYTVLRWAGPITKVELGAFANLMAFLERVGARPAVRAAHEAESASKAA